MGMCFAPLWGRVPFIRFHNRTLTDVSPPPGERQRYVSHSNSEEEMRMLNVTATLAFLALAGSALSADPPGKGEPNKHLGGLQVALLSGGGDLSTTASGGFSLGAFYHRRLDEKQGLRFTLDSLSFGKATQNAPSAGLQQTVDTTVKAMSIGAEYRRIREAWSFGAGPAYVHWTVDSTNRVANTGGQSVVRTGSADWWKPGFQASVGYAFNPHLALEGRFLASKYGYEDAAVQVLSLQLAWTF